MSKPSRGLDLWDHVNSDWKILIKNVCANGQFEPSLPLRQKYNVVIGNDTFSYYLDTTKFLPGKHEGKLSLRIECLLGHKITTAAFARGNTEKREPLTAEEKAANQVFSKSSQTIENLLFNIVKNKNTVFLVEGTKSTLHDTFKVISKCLILFTQNMLITIENTREMGSVPELMLEVRVCEYNTKTLMLLNTFVKDFTAVSVERGICNDITLPAKFLKSISTKNLKKQKIKAYPQLWKLKEECDNLINTKMNTGTDADGVGMFICKACEKPLHLFATRSRQVNTTESSSLDTHRYRLYKTPFGFLRSSSTVIAQDAMLPAMWASGD
jgi:hypothetical protein